MKQFEITEANLKKLEELWDILQEIIVSLSKTLDFSQKEASLYENVSLYFKGLIQGTPRIEGYKIDYLVKPYSLILRNYIDISNTNDIVHKFDFDEEIFLQGQQLNEYKFRLRRKRQELARQKIFEICVEIEKDLDVLQTLNPSNEYGRIEHPIWNDLQQKMDSMQSIIGNSVQLPPRWRDMVRHIGYGQVQDANDIINADWPSIRDGLEEALRRKYDPIPISTEDIGVLVNQKPEGNVVTELKWNNLSPSAFERLIFNLVSSAESYDNPQWLTHTNAPDKGRDLSVYRVIKDALAETIRQRIIIACKHYTSKSVNITEVETLRAQSELWCDPRVDILVIATSGRFTTDAIEKIEKNNGNGKTPRIEMWSDSTLERLLAQKPELIAEFDLR